MKRLLILCVVACLAVPTFAKDEDEDQNKAEDRVKAASTVLEEIESAPDQGIPEEVLGSAECVAVVPTMLKGGFIVGARFGRGVASCRTPKGWSAPAFFTIKGGSFGLQIGAQAVDLVMLIMNDNGMKNLLSSQFKLGADASVAAGPVGRHAAADTDWKLKAQVLSYSRARGLFAGLELSGAAIGQDKDATREFYGRMVPFKTSLTGTIDAPPNAYPFLNTLAKWAKTAASEVSQSDVGASVSPCLCGHDASARAGLRTGTSGTLAPTLAQPLAFDNLCPPCYRHQFPLNASATRVRACVAVHQNSEPAASSAVAGGRDFSGLDWSTCCMCVCGGSACATWPWPFRKKAAASMPASCAENLPRSAVSWLRSANFPDTPGKT